VRCRQTYFYVDQESLPDVVKVVVEVLVP